MKKLLMQSALLTVAVLFTIGIIILATDPTVFIRRATMMPNGSVKIVYRYRIGCDHELQASNTYFYDEWVKSLRARGFKVAELWR